MKLKYWEKNNLVILFADLTTETGYQIIHKDERLNKSILFFNINIHSPLNIKVTHKMSNQLSRRAKHGGY